MLIHNIWLSLCKNIGTVLSKLLIDYFGSAEKVYYADTEQLIEIDGLGKIRLKELMNKDLSMAEQIIQSCGQKGFAILSVEDAAYPDRLRNIYDPPTVLYVRGHMPLIDTLPVVGIVGTRWCTPYGYKNAEKLGHELSETGVIITTGLAKGIDTAAAIGALQGKMPVIGVIACGVDIVYPQQNRKLFEKIAENGAIISEYPPGTEPLPAYFPSRNRIISGLSNGVAIIEAPESSGALITAHRALEQCRDIFVLPGNVGARACHGSNKLLREGAIPFITSEDIIDEYRDLYPNLKKPIDNNAPLDYIDVDKLSTISNPVEKAIVDALTSKSLYVDEIIESTGITAQTTLTALTSLELSGLAGRDNNGKWEII